MISIRIRRIASLIWLLACLCSILRQIDLLLRVEQFCFSLPDDLLGRNHSKLAPFEFGGAELELTGIGTLS